MLHGLFERVVARKLLWISWAGWLAFSLFLLPGVAHAEGPPPRREADVATARALDNLAAVAGPSLFQTTRIYDRHGNLIYELADYGRRDVVALQQIPRTLIEATVATEDKHFYVHGGVDFAAVARAAWLNWSADTIVSGGSTITQQLARGLLMTVDERYELSFQRKTREASMAVDLESRFSKDEILEMYLNTVYYGNQAYGVAAAARTYFNKSVSELTPAESTLLAGLPQSPVAYDPFANPEAAKGRQRVVIDLLRKQGNIDGQQAATILAAPLNYAAIVGQPLSAPHFVDYVRDLLVERYGTVGLRRGLQVYTSIDLRYQELAQAIARAQVADIGEKHNFDNAAIVILHPPTGQILAMVGSVDFYDERIGGQINMATHPRQPGSAIKPITYATAFEHGWSPASVLWDTPVTFQLSYGGQYSPHNITGRYYGPLRLRVALSNSLNISTIKLLDELGVPTFLESAAAMGIAAFRQPVANYGLSITVGGYEVPLLELTHAFATLANSGMNTPLQPITEIRDSAGRVVFAAPKPALSRRAISAVSAYQVSSILSDNRSRQMLFGANSPLHTSQPAAVKTGTTTDFRDNLAVGYTPYMAVGVWVGNTDNKPMRNAHGVEVAAPIWHDVMEAVWANADLNDSLGYSNQPLPQGFPDPPGIIRSPVCEIQPGRFNENCSHAYEEVFAAAQAEPQQTWADRRGYCLSTFDPNLPESIQRQVMFVQFPRGDRDQEAARSWADRFNLPLVSYEECDFEPISRELAKTPAPAKPKRLIRIFEPPPTVAGEALVPGDEPIRPGGYVTLQPWMEEGLNIRSRPGQDTQVIGYLRAGHVAVVLNGPERGDGVQWYEIRNIDTGQIGWVHARFVRNLRPIATGELKLAIPAAPAPSGPAKPSTWQPGDKVKLHPQLAAAFLRRHPGSDAAAIALSTPSHRLTWVGGPQIVGDSAWYAVRDEIFKLEGWVHGALIAPASTE